jgi:hypothetical protein
VFMCVYIFVTVSGSVFDYVCSLGKCQEYFHTPEVLKSAVRQHLAVCPQGKPAWLPRVTPQPRDIAWRVGPHLHTHCMEGWAIAWRVGPLHGGSGHTCTHTRGKDWGSG